MDVSLGELEFASYGEKGFSGGIRYETDFVLNDIQGDLIIDLGEINCCCTVEVNGNNAGSIFVSPFWAEIPSDILYEGKNHLSVTLYNTAANVYANTDFDDVLPEVRGPYHGRTLELEKQAVQFLNLKNNN